MSRFLSYTFPAARYDDICIEQNVLTGNSFIFNGNLADKTTGTLNFLKYGYSRSISISSTNDYSTCTFTVVGTQNGVTITEDIIGPSNNDPSYSQQIYDTITSIILDEDVDSDVLIGTGYLGFFPLIGVNLNKDVINYTLTVAKITTYSIPFAIYGTLSDIRNNGSTYYTNLASKNIFTLRALASGDQDICSSNGTPIYSFLIVYLEGTAGTFTNGMQLNFIQT